MNWEQAYNDMVACARITRTEWKYDTSAGVEVSFTAPGTKIGLAGTTGMLRFESQRTRQKLRLNYAGAGGTFGGGLSGLVAIPLNGTFATPDMPSQGVLYKLPYACRTLSISELKGGFMMVQGSADAGIGKAYGTMFLGGNLALAAGSGPLAPAILAGTSNACLAYEAMFVSAIGFNIGVTAYVGAIV